MKLRRKRILWILLAFAAALILGCTIYLADYYHASPSVRPYLDGTAGVRTESFSDGIFFDGPGEEQALIFYPGAKVEYTAYAPLMSALAERGLDCFLVKMPANIALLGMNRASSIMEKRAYSHWYIGGHSLGGAAASMYAAKHGGPEGLILLAAYPVSPMPLRALELYGSEDGVLNMKKRAEGDAYLLTDDSSVQVIEGGCHAGFGSYGRQKGDGTARISEEEQQAVTAEKILEFTGA